MKPTPNTLTRSRRVITVRKSPLDNRRGLVCFGGIVVPAALGRSGRSAFKREGDGATPIASMRLLHGFVRQDRVRHAPSALPMRHVRNNMLWCDDPRHPAYNRLVRVPFHASHEEMARVDSLYDICLVLDWNITSRRRYRGSAIFMHLIRPGYEPTAGCVALKRSDMQRLLRHVRKGDVVRVVA